MLYLDQGGGGSAAVPSGKGCEAEISLGWDASHIQFGVTSRPTGMFCWKDIEHGKNAHMGMYVTESNPSSGSVRWCLLKHILSNFVFSLQSA